MGRCSKAGCNNGSCHGSFQGKNGFRLSLFGFDPDKDYAALIPHEGGARFGKDSWQYQVFREWIRQGAPRTKGSGEIVDIAVTPKEYIFVKTGKATKLKVTAKFAD